MASRLGRRIALAVAVPATLALGAVALFAVRAARDAERDQVVRRMEAVAAALAEDPRFFLEAPLDSAEIRERLARLLGIHFVLDRGAGAAPTTSLSPAAAAEAMAAAPAAAHGDEIRAGGEGYLALRRDRGPARLLLLFPTEAVDRAGRATAIPVLVASAAGVIAALAAGLLLGERLARPLAGLAAAARRTAAGGDDERADEARGPAEARELAAALNALLDARRRAEEARVARERLAVLGEFAAGVAHEIRNPLSSMRMTLQLLADGAAGKDAEDLVLLLDEVRRLEGSVEDLLLYAGKPALERKPVDLAAVARDAARLLGRQGAHLGVAIRVEEAPGTPPAAGDAPRLRTCVANLVLNAVQASPRGAEVRVAVARGGRGVVLDVSDSGPGIPPDLRDRVFEPFFSGRPGGTGLGLAVTRRLVEAHGGTISFASGPAGTVFRAELPESPPGG